jgi:hypothetical protein
MMIVQQLLTIKNYLNIRFNGALKAIGKKRSQLQF